MSDNTPESLTFDQLELSKPVLKAIAEVGYESPSPIQAESIPSLMEGRDLLGQAQTGTGKTGAFALPLLSKMDLSKTEPQVLVLTPTRELAIQVAEAFQTYARHMPGFHVLPIYGGQHIGVQLQKLRRGVHVVVGTPGRVMDHLTRKTLKLDSLQTLVLDEADEMLRMGFIDDVEWILEHTPSERQIALFSATMPDQVRKVAKRHLKSPVEIKVKSKTSTVETTTQHYWRVEGTNKLDALTRILEVEPFDAMIIFVRTKNATAELSEKLEARGYSCAALSGDIPQKLREKTVDRLKKKSIDILVATDVAARGLDVDRITHVLNYDIPYDTEAYVHRIGRTGRAGREGKAILFVANRERGMLRAIERATRQPIEKMLLPTNRDIAKHRAERFKAKISSALEEQELDYFQDLITEFQTELDVPMEKLAAALAYMAQAERQIATVEDDKPDFSDRPRGPRMNDEDMQSYRIEVGRNHGVQAGNIVGAIANEAGIESSSIGRIKLFDNFSTVGLPKGMPAETFDHLKNVIVCGHPLQISVDRGSGYDNSKGGGSSFKKKPTKFKPSFKNKGKGKGKGKFKGKDKKH